VGTYMAHLPSCFPWATVVKGKDLPRFAESLIEFGGSFAITSDVSPEFRRLWLSTHSKSILLQLGLIPISTLARTRDLE
jgi:hypothetical protein